MSCSCLMKGLWLGRLGRPDVQKAIQHLATKIHKWTKNHDRMLHRLMCYLWATRD